MKLTKRAIAAIAPDSTRDKCVWDDEVRGFGLRIKPTGVRSFIVQYRNSSRISRRMTIGKFGVLTVEEARTLAKRVLADVIRGADPAEKRSEERKAMTVRQLCDAYVEAADKGLILGKRGQPKKNVNSLRGSRPDHASHLAAAWQSLGAGSHYTGHCSLHAQRGSWKDR